MLRSQNYAAWSLDPALFDQESPERRLQFLSRFAVLAPSSHNSQPWQFSVDGDTIVAAPDMRRALPQSDKNHRQLYLSLGCAVENVVIAAEYYGYLPEVSLANENGAMTVRIRCMGEPIPAGQRSANHAALAIQRRHTNRNKYEARMPEASFLEWMRGMANDSMQFHFVSEEPKKAQVVQVVSDALIAAMDDDGFREELSHYIRPNITRATTGMPMSGFGMPTPPSFLAPLLLKKFNVNRLSRKQDEELLARHTPLFIIITTKANGAEQWISAGSAYERIAVEGEKRGIKTAPMAAAIQIGEHYRELQKILGTDSRPQMFFRIGYAAAMPPHSPRIPADGVMGAKK